MSQCTSMNLNHKNVHTSVQRPPGRILPAQQCRQLSCHSWPCAEASLDNNVTLPRHLGNLFNIVDLLPNGEAYVLMLNYLQKLWPALHILNDSSVDDGVVFYRSKSCRLISYVHKDGIGYGSTSNKRTNADSMAFILNDANCAVPAEIVALLSVKVGEQRPQVCAIVCRIYQDQHIHVF